ncbi:unnamed protein product [Timema podura]|uniref:Selenoprotein P N-terminal domain-containing protein n=1 Tax=Timema podura TaxID=61482 RepID=A0ABN7NSZ6_TIMPD|nr:unnamed protein product [Timema podura]
MLLTRCLYVISETTFETNVRIDTLPVTMWRIVVVCLMVLPLANSYLEHCQKLPDWSIEGKTLIPSGSVTVEFALRVSHSLLMSFDRMKPRSGDWAVMINILYEAAITSLLDQLRSRLNSAGFSDLNFLIVNSAAAAKETLGLKTMRSMAGEIPVYQEPANGSIWGNVLEGGVDHILIMDRCVRLVYQVIMPWSILNYPYVKAAILSTYNEDPCGPCIHPTISIPSNATIPSNKTELSFPGNTTTEIPNQIAPAPVDNITVSVTTTTTPGNIAANLKFDKAITSNRTKNHAEYSREVSTTETDPTGEQGTLLPVLSLEDGTVPIKVIIHFPHTHEQGSSILRSEYINPTGKEQRKQKWRGQHLRTTTTEIPTTPSEEKNIEEVFDDQPNYAPSYENYQPISTEEEEKHSQREHKEGENMRQEGGGKHHHKNKVMDEEGLGQSETQSENILSVKKSEVERNMLGEEQQNKGEKDQVLVKERDKVEDQKSEQIVQENQNEEDLDSTKNMIIKHYSKLLSWLDYPL